jgi:hypothetical protein
MLRKVCLIFSLLLVLSVGTKASHQSQQRQRLVSTTTASKVIIIIDGDDWCEKCDERGCWLEPCDPNSD